MGKIDPREIINLQDCRIPDSGTFSVHIDANIFTGGGIATHSLFTKTFSSRFDLMRLIQVLDIWRDDGPGICHSSYKTGG